MSGHGNQAHQVHLADLSERPLSLNDLTGGNALRSDHLSRARAAVGHGCQRQRVVGTHRVPAARQTGGDAAGCKTVVRAGQRYCGRLGPQTTGGEKDLHVLIPRQRIRWAVTIMRR